MDIKPKKGDPTDYVATKCTFVKRGDRVTFRNSTGGKVELQFAVFDLFDCDSETLLPRKRKTLKVGKFAKGGEYPFAAYCHKGGKGGRFALGGSMPIIIVDPR